MEVSQVIIIALLTLVHITTAIDLKLENIRKLKTFAVENC